MADPDFRALGEELSDELEEWIDGYLISDPPDEYTDAAYAMIERTSDALAQPAPEPPTDEKLTALVRVFQAAYNAKRAELRALPNPYREDTASDMADHAGISAVLARWGQGNG